MLLLYVYTSPSIKPYRNRWYGTLPWHIVPVDVMSKYWLKMSCVLSFLRTASFISTRERCWGETLFHLIFKLQALVWTWCLRFSNFPTHCKPSRWCETIVYKHSGLDIHAVTLWQSLCCFDYYSNLFIPLISFFTWWSTCLVSQRTSFAMFLSPNVKYLFSFEVHFLSYWLCFENLRFYLLYSAMCSSFTDVVRSGSCLLLILAHTSEAERCLLADILPH